jgi:GT2 family glycosyltransferase
LLAARVLVGAERRLDPISTEMRGPAPAGLPGPRVRGFLGCAAIVRRDAFLATGGFCERFLIGAEEELLAIDLRVAGWDLCYLDGIVAVHHPHLADRGPRGWLSRRNALWTSWLRKPLRLALRDTAVLVWQGRRDQVARRASASAVRGLPWALAERRPVPPWLLREWWEGNEKSRSQRPLVRALR